MKVFTDDDVRVLADWALVAVVFMLGLAAVVLFSAFVLGLAVRLFEAVV